MKNLEEYSVILWDFDGVLLDSMHIRDLGFEKVLASYSPEQIQALMQYHRVNGGLSRYVKFRYFFEKILHQSVDEETIQKLAESFSQIMLSLLMDEKLIISDSLNYVVAQFGNKQMHIVSGSDGVELRQICKELKIDQYFKSIEGSPTPKKKLIADLLTEYQYDGNQVILIGDSVNDQEAAAVNSIAFAGYNNPSLSNPNQLYIHSFHGLMNVKQ